MNEMTVSQLREKINNKLLSAKLQVQKLEEQLKLFDCLVQEEEETIISAGTPSAERTTVSPERNIVKEENFSEDESVGKAITETIRGMDGNFNVRSIAQIIAHKFPAVTHGEISKKFAAKAYRLQRRGEIECVKKGYGRTPNTYKRVIK